MTTETAAAAPSILADFKHEAREWLRVKGPFWAASAGGHLLAVALVGVLAGTIEPPKPEGEAPEFESVVDTQIPEPQLTRFDIGETSLEPSVLDTASLLELDAPEIEQTEQINSDSSEFEEAGGGFSSPTSPLNTGGLGGFTVAATGDGAAIRGLGGIGSAQGNNNSAGAGGSGTGFGGRGTGMRKALAGAFGGTKQTDRAVAGTVSWLARHQNSDGGWSLNRYHVNCKDPSCREAHAEETIDCNAAATALALLPFLAAGQTHETKGPYQKTIRDGLDWLITHQDKSGDLSDDAKGKQHQMYTHGLCAIVLCEAYGMSKDRRLHNPAQYALSFIEATQNETGGWRYNPSSIDADTSVVGWQLMALKSGQMGGLDVNPKTLDRAKGFLKTVSRGSSGGLFSYMSDGSGASHVMTSVGLLCNQYMGMKKTDPAMVEGMNSLMANLPGPPAQFNSYYTYYATMVMHNLPGQEWDKWNREMRRSLLDTQVKDGCAAGSWSPANDAWGKQGGRLMTTAISALSLEVYYRYIPLYKLDDAGDMMQSESAGGED